jgi:branched-chain amino acid transport system ATP-binding protein
MSLLRLSGVTARYGATQALFDVSLEVGAGQVLALMGRNGMGKSTTVKAICGMIPAQGTITFDGHDLTRLPSHRAARLGIGLVPEGRRCFAPLTVAENLSAAARPGPWDRAAVTDLFPQLEARMGQTARTLSGGEQQMLAIGRALMTNPRLLILDEATEGLAPLIRHDIWHAIARIRAETGMAIVLIDKTLQELRTVADTAVVLERGATVWSGPMADMGPDITNRYLGL